VAGRASFRLIRDMDGWQVIQAHIPGVLGSPHATLEPAF
jgi:hypothetical protein